VLGDWTQFGRDPAHSGVSGDTPAPHGSVVTLTEKWQIRLASVADAPPIVQGSTLYITLNTGATYAFNTANGGAAWAAPFTTTGGINACGGSTPIITTGGPALDVAANMLYVNGVDGKVHRLNPATGVEIAIGGFPATVTLSPAAEKLSSPLTIANGFVYGQTSGNFGDCGNYDGHVFAISTSSGAVSAFNANCSNQTGVIAPSACATPSFGGDGMWSRAGVVVDPDAAMNGRVYTGTGNGPYDGSTYFGDSVIALASGATSLADHFTPSNFMTLQNADIDQGSSGPALLPRNGTTTPLVAVQGGKAGVFRLLDRSNLNGGGAVVQTVQSFSTEIMSAPAVYAGSGTTYVYLGMQDGVHAFVLSTLSGTPQLTSAWTGTDALGSRGTSVAVRGNVVYAAANNLLVAYDATTGTKLGSSNLLGTVHWQSPVVTGGVVYCADTSGNLTAWTIGP
jgi:outer membrane protein assembly factor BamB